MTPNSLDSRQPCHNCSLFQITHRTEIITLHTHHLASGNVTPIWTRCPSLLRRNLPADLADWLLNSGSLTRRLRQQCRSHFQVRILGQGWSRPIADESRVLGLRLGAWAWIREVQLLGDHQPWVFARTLIPADTLRGRGRRLTRLGSRPLGEVLFADPGVRRGPVEIARIAAGHRLHQRAFADCPEPPDLLWGRRSLFWIAERPLLVCEIFLPDLPVTPICYRPD